MRWLVLILVLACSKTPSGPTRHYTFRAIGGVSMGGVGSSRLAARYPELFDAAAFLGGPLDAPLLAKTLETTLLGGFCPPDKLAAATNLDDPNGVPGCVQQDVPGLTSLSRAQRFNRWQYTVNGGHFDRGEHLDIFKDLTLAIGNPLAMPIDRAALAAATCDSPARVPHVYDATYSPHGEHDAITFCDGDAPLKLCPDDTPVDWCAAAALNGHTLAVASDADAFCASHGGAPRDASQNATDPAEAALFFSQSAAIRGCWGGTHKVDFALAIDLNGNGRRDYHEPILLQLHEPFRDVGVDGCDDAHEDGHGGCTATANPGAKDPNGDNYDPVTNPSGTEGNFLYDPGEPFDDVGLDGVAGTHDEGEGDGKFTISAGLQQWYAGDVRLHRPAMDLYYEGGIRDVFDLGAMARAAAGGAPDARRFGSFFDIPSANGAWGATFDPMSLDPTALAPQTLVNYGNANASPADIRAGDGDHVGTPEQAYDRFVVFFRWLARRWQPAIPLKAVQGVGVSSLHHFTPPSLGAQQDYAITLPPGYDDPANAQKRYPVLYLLHGYGQSPSDFSGTGIFATTLLNLGLLQEIIVVYPSGRCCLTGPHGERTCRDQDDNGTDYTSLGYVRECARGSFYVDSAGNGTKYGAALVDLMREIDANYRTRSPEDGPAD